MKRVELIQRVSAKQDKISTRKMAAAVNYIFNTMSQALGNGRRIEIRGFGSFSIRLRAERMVRNPKTGLTIRQEPRYSLHFKPGKEMQDRVNL